MGAPMSGVMDGRGVRGAEGITTSAARSLVCARSHSPGDTGRRCKAHFRDGCHITPAAGLLTCPPLTGDGRPESLKGTPKNAHDPHLPLRLYRDRPSSGRCREADLLGNAASDVLSQL